MRASGRLEPFIKSIQEAFDEAIKEVAAKLQLSRVDIVVADLPASAIPETGVGGYAPNAHLLYIYINPESPGLAERLRVEIKSTLAHELHHCARWAAVGYGTTLLEAMISEGLADHFDLEVNGGTPRPWSTALQPVQLQSLLARAREEFPSANYSHDDWFFGSEKEQIPHWTGYSLGYFLVDSYIKSSGKTASSLVAASANMIATDNRSPES